MKIEEQLKIKMSQDQISQGAIPSQNSFAVLNNSSIIVLAAQMGIHAESTSYEKIDMLKGLENATMKLNEQNIGPSTSGNKRMKILPLKLKL